MHVYNYAHIQTKASGDGDSVILSTWLKKYILNLLKKKCQWSLWDGNAIVSDAKIPPRDFQCNNFMNLENKKKKISFWDNEAMICESYTLDWATSSRICVNFYQQLQ